MTPEQRTSLVSLVNELEQSSAKRKEFIDDPFNSIRSTLKLPEAMDASDVGLTNELLASIFRDPKLTESLRQIGSQHQSNVISMGEAKKLAALSIASSLPAELKVRLNKDWLNNVGVPGDPKAIGIANLLVAVDQVAVIDQAAVLHSTYFFSGAGIQDKYDIKKITDAFSGGQ